MKVIRKRLMGILFCSVFVLGSIWGVPSVTAQAAQEWPAGPKIDTPNAIVMEVSTGTVLYEKNADEVRYPASITKIMTTLLALENASLNEVVTFSQDAVYKNEGDTSHISRDIGEEMTLEECLYAVMLESANECAYAVAEHVGEGDYQKFIDMMNERAQSLGCTNTHFSNSNGLPDETHVTTCRDMALISRAAIQNSAFRKIVGTVRYEIPPTNKHKDITPLNNHHQMISVYKGAGNLYEPCIGGKTGYTVAAGNTLVTFAEKDGMTLVCVVMNCGSGGIHYKDTRKLFEYCFDTFRMVNVAENENRYPTGETRDDTLFSSGEAFAALDSSARIVLPKEADFTDTSVELSYDRVTEKIVGTLVYQYEDKQVGMADVVTTGVKAQAFKFGSFVGAESGTGEKNAESAGAAVSETQTESASGEQSMEKIITIAIVAGLAVAALLIIRFLYNNIHRIFRGRTGRDRRYKTIKNNRKWNRRGGR